MTSNGQSGAAVAEQPANGVSRTRSISMGTWLAVAIVAVTALSLLVGTVFTVAQATRLGEDVLRARFRGVLSLQAEEIERYLGAAQRHAQVLASSGTVPDAATQFRDAYDDLDQNLREARVSAATDELSSYYRGALLPMLEQISGEPVAVRRVLPTQPATRYLQSLYTIPDPLDGVDVRERTDADDGSEWSDVHAELHPTLSELADRLDFADLALIAPDSGTVVYTVAKLPDLGTSLDIGPYSGSVLAQGFRAVRDDPEAGSVLVTDIAPYGPAGGAPASFVLAPVLDDDQLVAVLAGRISVDEIDRIMTAGGQWRDAGFGQTGETFLVGDDGRMRSVARAFVEDPDRYLQTVEQAGTATSGERAAMRATGTTVPVQEVFTDAEMAAVASGEPSLIDPLGYRGEEVRTAVAPVDVSGLDWAVITQITEEEFAGPLIDYRRAAVVAAVIVVVIIAFAAVAWARRAFGPVRAISERLQRLHEHDDPGPVAVGNRASAEFAELAHSVDAMIGALHRRRAEVDAAIADRRAAMRALLPASVAERIDVGDRRVVEEISQASVAVVTVDGLSRLLRHGDAGASREVLDRIVGALDPLAERHGLVRVKLLGDAYFAGCGLDRPYLDHAARAVAFALAAHEAVRHVTDDTAAPIRLSGGVDTGPLVVGLTGSALLVFDMWGETSTAAHHLAQRALSGETLVSERTRDLLPPDVVTVRYDAPGPPTWRVVDAAPVGAKESTS